MRRESSSRHSLFLRSRTVDRVIKINPTYTHIHTHHPASSTRQQATAGADGSFAWAVAEWHVVSELSHNIGEQQEQQQHQEEQRPKVSTVPLGPRPFQEAPPS